MLSVALAILLAIKKQVLKLCQSRIPSAESSEVLTQTRMAQMNFWLLTSSYLTSERKEVLKSILIYLLAPFLCRYLLKNKNSFLFYFFLLLMRGLSKPALYRSTAEASGSVHWYQWPLVEADYLLLVHKSTCQPYLESGQLISMDYWNHLLQK